MLGTIAVITILSAILVFFVDELMAYAKKLMDRPYIFLVFGLMTLTVMVDLHPATVLWLVITWWIGLLLLIQWLADHLFLWGAEQFFAKWLLTVVLSLLPIILAVQVDVYKRKHDFYNKTNIKPYGYGVALVLWVSTLVLFTLGYQDFFSPATTLPLP